MHQLRTRAVRPTGTKLNRAMGHNVQVRHVLDDPAWHSLVGPLARFATGAGAARRISPQHSIFTAVDPAADPVDAGRDLAAVLAPGERGVLVGARVVVPPGFHELGRGTALQMVLDDDVSLVAAGASARGIEVAELGESDVVDMLALIDNARPGPFLERTVELGTYLGVRADGELIAMAGERLRPPGYVEISAVSTHDRARRRGLALLVVSEVATRALARGDTPFLHVVTTNEAAIPVYERLGFRTRCRVDFVAYERDTAR
jgi:ribosomal protein S18 acetylase RimI-like enzyme